VLLVVLGTVNLPGRRSRPGADARRARDPSDRPRFRWMRETGPLSTGRRALFVTTPYVVSPTPGDRGTLGSWYPTRVAATLDASSRLRPAWWTFRSVQNRRGCCQLGADLHGWEKGAGQWGL